MENLFSTVQPSPLSLSLSLICFDITKNRPPFLTKLIEKRYSSSEFTKKYLLNFINAQTTIQTCNLERQHETPRRTKHTVTRNGSWWGRDRAAEPSAEGWNRPARVEGTGGKRACEPGDGRRWWILFYTLIYCRRYFLVGASWRLPHHRTRQWWPLDILFRIIARLAGPFYFGLYRTTPLRSAFFPDSSLSSRKLCANGAQYPLRIRRLSFHRGFTISRDRTEGFSDTGDMLDVCLFSWLRNSINLTRFRILYYKRMYVFPS